MRSISVCDVNFDIHDGPVAVSVSGGADSAMLLYMVLSTVSGPVTVYTCSSAQKGYAAPRYAYDVILKCAQLTGRHDIQHVVYFVEQQTLQTLITPIARALHLHKYTVVYTGSTALPPDSESHNFVRNSGLHHIRNPNVVREHYNGATRQYYSPFFNVNKRKIHELYRHYNLVDTLYPVTRSCESLTLTSGHCGDCWWCEERVWAFGRYT